ncbi:glycosyltransferase [Polynucleobacter sp. MWH-UH19D]|uniref:glycosyltransferase n=1 Tax=Polynucleobacter sp. MWH-UH19D TaxID=1855610 RepID=UPI003364B744
MNVNQFPGGFTVLMAVYRNDDVELFNRAVQSVFANTLLPNHCLIMVDGPVPEALDSAISSLEKAYSPKIQFLRLSKNIGLAKALNAGIAHIHTEWIVRADADDMNLPNRFSELAKAIQGNPEVDLLGSNILEVDKEGNSVAIREVPTSEVDIRQFVKSRNPFNHMTVAYRRSAVLECGGYPDVYLREDYALWCQFLVRQKRVLNIFKVLVLATAGKEMYARRGGWRYAKAEWEMQRLLVDSGLKGISRGLLDGLLRSIIFVMPSRLRGCIYHYFLRKSAI